MITKCSEIFYKLARLFKTMMILMMNIKAAMQIVKMSTIV